MPIKTYIVTDGRVSLKIDDAFNSGIEKFTFLRRFKTELITESS
jgi:hypothetical protein